MNKKIYLAPAVHLIGFVEEGMIATSMTVHEENIGEEFTQKQELDMWGNEDIWK